MARNDVLNPPTLWAKILNWFEWTFMRQYESVGDKKLYVRATIAISAYKSERCKKLEFQPWVEVNFEFKQDFASLAKEIF